MPDTDEDYSYADYDSGKQDKKKGVSLQHAEGSPCVLYICDMKYALKHRNALSRFKSRADPYLDDTVHHENGNYKQNVDHLFAKGVRCYLVGTVCIGFDSLWQIVKISYT